MSWYLTIAAGPNGPRWTPTAPLVAFLAEQPEFVRTGPATFGPAAGAPWVHVVLAACDPPGCYAVFEGPPPPEVDIVELICSYSGAQEWYDALAAASPRSSAGSRSRRAATAGSGRPRAVS